MVLSHLANAPLPVAWVENGGVVGRGVLLDYAAWAEANNVQFDPFSTHVISAKTLQEIAASQGTELKEGDILFIRSGWVQAYSQLSETQAKNLADIPSPPAVGIESSEHTLRWLWETGFAAVAGDMPSMEAWPCQNTQFWLHEWLLAGWGMPIGELFDLEKLSEECRRQGRWSFFFSSVPLRVSKLSQFISSPLFQVDDSSRYPEELPAHPTEWQFCSLDVYSEQNRIFTKRVEYHSVRLEYKEISSVLTASILEYCIRIVSAIAYTSSYPPLGSTTL